MRKIPDLAVAMCWALATLATLYVLYATLMHEAPLYLLFMPVIMGMFAALTIQPLRYSLAVVLCFTLVSVGAFMAKSLSSL